MLVNRARAMLAAVLLVSAFGLTDALSAAAKSRPRPHKTTHKTTHHSSGIPQHNGGDHDTDNNGAPSDGDGNV